MAPITNTKQHKALAASQYYRGETQPEDIERRQDYTSYVRLTTHLLRVVT